MQQPTGIELCNDNGAWVALPSGLSNTVQLCATESLASYVPA